MSSAVLSVLIGGSLGFAGLFAFEHSLKAEGPLPEGDSATIQQEPTAPELSASMTDAQRIWADRFPNVDMVTHEGREVKFYDDLLKGKKVAINFFYIGCKDF